MEIKMNKAKQFLRLIINLIIFTWAAILYASDSAFLTITNLPGNNQFKPLEWVELKSSKPGTVIILDGNGVAYVQQAIEQSARVRVAGALGTHTVILLDENDKLLDTKNFKVDCKTELNDKGGEFSSLLDMLYYTMNTGHTTSTQRYKGKSHVTFAGWFQDHVHVMKAMKYFYPDVVSGINLFADSQREDGMIYDNYYQSYDNWIHWLKRFGPDFVSIPEDPAMNSSYFVRIPVENMGEFTFLEAVYYAWKATGDDSWMAGKLDNCIKAIKYATSDPYRWSEKFKLLKRGYTIDIWDFQPIQDIEVWNGDIMMAKPGVTNFSIMYGDNIGMAVGCEYTAEMLRYVGRNEEATKIEQIGKGIKERLDALSWNGSFYIHHIPEDSSVKRDFGGTDESRQVTISNAYAINRRIGHDKSVAIIKTYQNIAKEMPVSSPGEWYMCYPPYEKGWHLDKWEYMNGGVSSIVAGEVAHGAFDHGFEDYGVHILRRMGELAKISGNRLLCIYRGALPDPPERDFTALSLKKIANADITGQGADGVPGWTGEGVNDLHEFPVGRQVFKDVPFTIVEPDENGRKACLILSGKKGYTKEGRLPVAKKAASVYFLHTQSRGSYLGDIILHYTDGSEFKTHVLQGQNIAGWWYPQDGPYNDGKRPYYVAWTGKNDKSLAVGVYIFGIDNPSPDKVIESINFESAGTDGLWMVLGVTLSDYPVFFMPEKISYGAPDNWGAAAVIYALLEGLAGIKDEGVAFNKARLAPRWSAAGVDEVNTAVKYPASGGYLSYTYKFDKTKNELLIDFTGTAANIEIELFIDEGQTVKDVYLNKQPIKFKTKLVEKSKYICFTTDRVAANEIRLRFK